MLRVYGPLAVSLVDKCGKIRGDFSGVVVGFSDHFGTAMQGM